MTPPAGHHRRGGHRQRVNWADALGVYIALGPDRRNFSEVARHYNITPQSVSKRAQRYGWTDIARAADLEAERRVVRRAVRTLEERNRTTIQLVETSRARYLQYLIENDGKDGRPLVVPPLNELVQLLKLEQVLGGQPDTVMGVPDSVLRLLALPDDALAEEQKRLDAAVEAVFDAEADVVDDDPDLDDAA